MVKDLAAQGYSGDVIAAKLQLNKNHLRAEHALDLHEGREIKFAEKAAAEAAAVALTKEEYHFLNACTLNFSSGYWFDDEGRSLLFDGTNGEGARTIEDAFAQWKADGGRFLCTGLSNDFDKKKYEQFSEIVSAYRQKLKGDEHGRR